MIHKKNNYIREIVGLRAAQQEEKMIVEGKAIVYEEPTLLFEQLGIKYYEVIERGAFTNADISEAYLKYNHSDVQTVLARVKNKTLKLTEKPDGVYIRAEIADTTLGRDVYELIKRGDIDKMSFAFTVKASVTEENKEEKSVTFRITEFDKIYDVAAVSHPAYQNTDIYARRRGEVESDLARVESRKRENIKRRMQIRLRCALGREPESKKRRSK